MLNDKERKVKLKELEKIYGKGINRFSLKDEDIKLAEKKSIFLDLDDSIVSAVEVENYATTETISKNFLCTLFENKKVYAKFLNGLQECQRNSDENMYPRIAVLRASNACEIIQYEYASIFRAAAENKDMFSKMAQSRLEEGLKLVDQEQLFRTQGSLIFMDIDGEKYGVEPSRIKRLLEMTDERFAEELETLDKRDAKKLAYAICKFLNPYDNKDTPYALCLYNFSSSVVKRYRDISEMKFVNFEELNKVIGTKSEISDSFSVHEDLKKSVYDSMPQDLSDAEKAIYIYARLCQILQYDDNYYLDSSVGGYNFNKHHNVERLSKITPDNNKIVCFDFACLFSKFMEDNGIRNELNMNPFENEYIGEHVYCKVRVDDVVFVADSTYKNGWDVVAAKVGEPLLGIVAKTRSEEKANKLKEITKKTTKNIEPFCDRMPFEKLLETYATLESEKIEISASRKFEFIKEMLEAKIPSGGKNEKLNGIEKMYYASDLIEAVFGKSEKSDDIQKIKNEPVFLYAKRISEDEKESIAGIVEYNDKGKRRYYEIANNYDGEQFNEVDPIRLSEDFKTGRIYGMGESSEFVKNFISRLAIEAKRREREMNGKER